MKRVMTTINLMLMMVIVYVGGLSVDLSKQGVTVPTLSQGVHVEDSVLLEGRAVADNTAKMRTTATGSLVEKYEVKPVELGYNTKVKLGMIEVPKENTSNNSNTTSVQDASSSDASGTGSGTNVPNDGHRYVKGNIQITFYTNTAAETDDSPNIVASNKQIAPGMVAMNGVKFGTKVHIPSLGKNIQGVNHINTFVVEDRMAPHEASKAQHRVDIYVPRISGENDYTYRKRVNSYGRYTVEGYIGYKN